MPKLTISSVTSIKPGERDKRVWDSELRGFGVKVTPKGRRIYIVYAQKDGHRRYVRLGDHGALTPTQARELAAATLADMAKGIDPRDRRRRALKAPTVDEVADRYLREHAEPYKKASSAAEDKRNLKLHIRPALGSKKIGDVTREDVARLHHSLRDRPYLANAVRALLSKMFNLAAEWSLRPDGTNPTTHVPKYRVEGRQRFLSESELTRLGTVLDKAEHGKTVLPSAATAIRLLLLTGCRVSEILRLRWEYIDFDNQCLRLPDSKTGAKVVQLGQIALETLRSLKSDRTPSPWVIPGARDGKPLYDLKSTWKRVRKNAKLDDVRIHDLRHTHAAHAASAGYSLHIVGALLGHKQRQTVERYAHLQADPVRQAADATGSQIDAAMKAGRKKVRAIK